MPTSPPIGSRVSGPDESARRQVAGELVRKEALPRTRARRRRLLENKLPERASAGCDESVQSVL